MREAACHLHAWLERSKVGQTVIILLDDLAIQDATHGQQFRRGDECGQPISPVQTVAAVDFDLAAPLVDLHAVAVELELDKSWPV